MPGASPGAGMQEEEMDDSGIPTFIAVIVSAVMVIGVIVAMAAVTWVFIASAG